MCVNTCKLMCVWLVVGDVIENTPDLPCPFCRSFFVNIKMVSEDH